MDLQPAENSIFTKTELFVVPFAGVPVCMWKMNVAVRLVQVSWV